MLCQKQRSRPQSLLEEGTFYSGCSRTLCHLETYFRQDAGSSAATSSETSPSIEQALPPVPSEPVSLPIRTSPPPPALPARQTPPPVRRAAPPTQPALPPSSQAPVAGKKYSPVMSYTHAHCTMAFLSHFIFWLLKGKFSLYILSVFMKAEGISSLLFIWTDIKSRFSEISLSFIN